MTLHPLTPAAVHGMPWLPDLEWGRAMWHAHTPYAHALHVEDFEEPMGAAGLVLHGDTALLDLLYVHPDERRRGLGTALLRALLAQVDALGCPVVANAPPAAVPWLQRHGFVPQQELLRCTGGRFYQATRDEVLLAEPTHFMAMAHLDRRATGEDRRTWLQEHTYIASAYVDGGRVRGFAIPLLRDALIVADAPDVGLELQRWVFPTQEHLIVPAENTAALQHLHERQYTTTVEAVRMVRGTPPTFKSDMVFAHP
ncbi:MAG: GNAT family N-acetyltransferase [Flavobacteriales bacterium]|nr:GNAT family N-acetyltransferase [Flavobacteriales bacterium]